MAPTDSVAAPSSEAPAKSAAPGWTAYTLPALLAIAALHTLYFARELFLPLIAAYFAKLVFSPAVRRLRRWGIPEPLGAGVVLGLALSVGAVAGYAFSGPANEWIARAPSILREARDELRALRKPVENVSRAAEQVEAMTNGGGQD